MAPRLHLLPAAVTLAVLCTHVIAEDELNGTSLHCCTVIASPYVVESNRRRGGFEGLSIDYLDRLKERTGFECKSLGKFEDPGGAVGWNAFIENMKKCTVDGRIINSTNCHCEIGVGAWFEIEERMGVDFVPPFMHDSLRVLVHVDATSTSTGGAFFLTSFNPSVWVSIAGLIVLFTFLKLLDRRFAPPDDSFVPLPRTEPRYERVKHFILKSKIPFRLRRAMQSTLSKMIGQSTKEIEGDDSSTRQWVLNFAVVLCGLFLVLAYEATMTASLVQETIQSDFRSVQDFKECGIADKDVCFVRGDVTQSFWDSAIATQRCRNNTKPEWRMFDGYDELMNKVATKKCRFMIASGGTGGTAVHGRYCGTLVMTGEPFYQGGTSFVLPKGSDLMEPMRKATLQFKKEDILDTMEQYFARHSRLCNPPTTPHLTFKKLQIFFIIAFTACGIIFLEMLLDPQTSTQQVVLEPPEEDVDLNNVSIDASADVHTTSKRVSDETVTTVT